MRVIAFLVSLFVLSSVASAQITQPEKQQPQQEDLGWVPIASPTTVTINRIVSQPSGTIWISNPEGLFRSKDLGESWFKIPDIGHCAVDFFDDSDGVLTLAGGVVRITKDGGATWLLGNPTELNSGGPNVVDPNLVFVASLSGISKSKDRGKTWFARQVDASSVGPLSFCDSSYGVVVGNIDLETSGTAFKTTDAGESWVRMQVPRYDLHDVYVLSHDTIFLASLYSKILRSINGGGDWVETTTPHGIDAVTFTSSDKGYAVGDKGLILYTWDAGETWIQQSTPTTEPLSEVMFLNDSIGFVTGRGGLILRTTTGGKSNVNRIPEPSPLSLSSYPDPASGFTHFEYILPESDIVSLLLFTIDGKKVKTIIQDVRQEQGRQSLLADVNDLAAGVYVLRLESTKYFATGRITIIR
jgi:photosystem II stability/assembly factor-like uncharacterized protein